MTVLDLQRPLVALAPESVSSAGAEAVDLARMAGLELDPWQALVLENSLGERADGKWAARDVGLIVPRQNGKNAILEARELAGLFLLGERLIVHTAHEGATAAEAMRRLEELIEGTPEFSRRVKAFWHANGKEAIELMNGQRIRFRTRTKGGGRGFSADCVVFDEAMILPDATVSALLPTLSARPNPQVWFTGSAVDQTIHDHGIVLTRIRERGHRGDPRLAFFEWAADVAADPASLTPEQISDPDHWREANPAYGVRILDEDIEAELVGMGTRGFAVERLGIGDWPSTDEEIGAAIDLAKWRGLVDASSTITSELAITFDVSPGRSQASICAAGVRDDGLVHVEVIDRREGTGWITSRLAEIGERQGVSEVYCDGVGPAASLVGDIEQAGVRVVTLSSAEYVQSCGNFYDLVDQKRLRHLGGPEMESAIRGAVVRPLVDAWAWSRKSSKVDITPLVAGTIATWRASRHSTGDFVF